MHVTQPLWDILLQSNDGRLPAGVIEVDQVTETKCRRHGASEIPLWHFERRHVTHPAMSETDDVLAANLEFYRAFAASDYPAMNALWARSAPVQCIHPGWPPLAGREAVMRSWRNILTNPQQAGVACHDDQAYLYDGVAVVICEEELPEGNLVASNMFVKEGGRWRMVQHQSSPMVSRPQDARSQRRRNERR